MGLSLDGIASGLDTAALISSQLAVDALPQGLLKAQVSQTVSKITDLRSLNARIGALATLSTASLGASALQTYTAVSSGAGVTVAATDGANAGTLDVTVTRLASAQTSVTAAFTAWPETPPTMTVVNSAGVKTTVTATSSSIAAMASAINASGAGVTATRVSSGTDANGDHQYRLQLTSFPSGAGSGFSVHNGPADQVSAANEIPVTSIRTASDASITLWKGTPAEQAVTSSTNTFADLMPGVSVTAASVSTDPATVTITRDPAKSTAVVQSIISALSLIFGEIDTKSKTTTVGSGGKAVTDLGSFTGDSTIRSVRQSLMTAVSGAVDGRSPSEIGIGFDKNGSIEFDDKKFAAALKADPAHVEAVFAAIATRVAAAAAGASDKSTGTITTKITGSESSVKNLNAQVENWDDRLAVREATLKATYAALEISMNRLNATSAYLTSQFAALNASASNN